MIVIGNFVCAPHRLRFGSIFFYFVVVGNGFILVCFCWTFAVCFEPQEQEAKLLLINIMLCVEFENATRKMKICWLAAT